MAYDRPTGGHKARRPRQQTKLNTGAEQAQELVVQTDWHYHLFSRTTFAAASRKRHQCCAAALVLHYIGLVRRQTRLRLAAQPVSSLKPSCW
jgi:hypothetical protein